MSVCSCRPATTLDSRYESLLDLGNIAMIRMKPSQTFETVKLEKSPGAIVSASEAIDRELSSKISYRKRTKFSTYLMMVSSRLIAQLRGL